MKSKNNLTITGVVVTDVTEDPDHRYGRFSIIHNFGNGKSSLNLPCVLLGKAYDDAIASGVRKGMAVTVNAYLRPRGEGVEAVVKGLSCSPSDRE